MLDKAQDAEKIIEKLLWINRSSGVFIGCHKGAEKNAAWIWPAVPKVATRSMRQMLGQKDIHLFTGSNAKHWLYDLNPMHLKNYYIWTFVRSPMTRVLSSIAYFQITEDQFVAKNYAYFEEAIQKGPRRVALHMLPSSFYTHINGEQFVDFIGRYENLNEDWQKLCRKIFKIPPNPLPHLEKWKSKNKPDMTDRLRATITEMYTDDFKYLEYDTGIQQ